MRADDPGPAGVPGTLGALGEFGLIDALAARLPRGPRTLVGIGDDAAVPGPARPSSAGTPLAPIWCCWP